jgi:hypothetical protein
MNVEKTSGGAAPQFGLADSFPMNARFTCAIVTRPGWLLSTDATACRSERLSRNTTSSMRPNSVSSETGARP